MAAEVKNKKKSQAAAVWRRLKKNKMAILGLVILSIIILLAIFADVLFDYDTMVIKQSGALRLKPPGFEGHLLGTDEVGRDILARIVHGARISLPVAFITIAIATVVGGLLGAIAGYGSKRLDNIIMRIMDVFLAIPSILLSIALVAALGTSMTNMMLAISISNIPPFARIVRSAVLTIKNEEYIEAARAIGAELYGTDYCTGNALDCRFHSCDCKLELHRSWHQSSDSGMGFHAKHRPSVFPFRVVGMYIPGHCDYADDSVSEPSG